MHIFGQLPNPVSSQLHTIVTQEKKNTKIIESPSIFWTCDHDVFFGSSQETFFWWMVKLHYTLEK